MKMFFFKFKIFFPLTVLVMLFVFTDTAYAGSISCTVKTGGFVVNVGNIIVQRDTPVGQAISNEISGTNAETYDCTVTQTGVTQAVKSTLNYSGMSDGLLRIYKTNVPGVGVAIGGHGSKGNGGDGDCYIGYGSSCTGTTVWGTDFVGYIGYSNSGTGPMTYFFKPFVKFYKIDTITPGNLSGQYGAVIAGERNPPNLYNTQPEIPITFGVGNVSVVSCSITTSNLTFPIGDILVSSFGSTVGTIPTRAKNTQNLGLDCDAGANINVMLQGTQNDDVSTTSVLALTGQGNADVAKGVGVQLLYNGSPLELNNRIVLKKSSGGQETFPITAQYYQTKTAVTTGKANASATLDLTYQ